MLIVARTSSSELIDSESSVPEGSEGSKSSKTVASPLGRSTKLTGCQNSHKELLPCKSLAKYKTSELTEDSLSSNHSAKSFVRSI